MESRRFAAEDALREAQERDPSMRPLPASTNPPRPRTRRRIRNIRWRRSTDSRAGAIRCLPTDPCQLPTPKSQLPRVQPLQSTTLPCELEVGRWEFSPDCLIMIPNQIGRREDRPSQARTHVMVAAAGFAHRDDATVATAHAASHHALHRHLRWSLVFSRDVRDRFEHLLRAARVDGDLAIRPAQLLTERTGDSSALAERTVLGAEHHADTLGREPIEVKELGTRARAVKQRGLGTALLERF